MPNSKETKAATLEQYIMDYSGDRYQLIVITSLWAKQLRKREDMRMKPNSDIISESLRQIMAGEVTQEQIMAAAKELAAEAKLTEHNEMKKGVKVPSA